MKQLKAVRGHRPMWPELLGAALNAEFNRQVDSKESYQGEVFKDRDKHPLEDGEREERLVARLYRTALSHDGCVIFQRKRIWLLGYQWPNQGGRSEKSRRADLIGITTEGALVVFEAKRAKGDPPLVALTEGLDYLACMLRPRNFLKIQSGFEKWQQKEGKVIPAGFESTIPDSSVRPQLFVLAPTAYFYSRSIRSRDWPFIAQISDTFMESVQLYFATTDFSSRTLKVPKAPKDSK